VTNSRSILVDTSVWIEYFRGSNEKIHTELDDILDQRLVLLSQVVRCELLSGVRKDELFKLERVLSSLTRIVPQNSTWELVESFTKIAVKKGVRFGVMDLLIASSAHEAEALIWSLDKDFKAMEKLGLIETRD